MDCKTKTALALANSMILGGEAMSEKAEKVIHDALFGPCELQKIAKDYLQLYTDGGFCCNCCNFRDWGERGREVSRYQNLWGGKEE